MILIGVNPHQRSHTATATGPGGVVLATIQVAALADTADRLVGSAGQCHERRWTAPVVSANANVL